jgi:hypothetical protein
MRLFISAALFCFYISKWKRCSCFLETAHESLASWKKSSYFSRIGADRRHFKKLAASFPVQTSQSAFDAVFTCMIMISIYISDYLGRGVLWVVGSRK